MYLFCCLGRMLKCLFRQKRIQQKKKSDSQTTKTLGLSDTIAYSMPYFDSSGWFLIEKTTILTNSCCLYVQPTFGYFGVLRRGVATNFWVEGTNRRQVANLPQKYPKNRKMHRNWVISSSNQEGTSPPKFVTGGDASPPSPRFRRPYYSPIFLSLALTVNIFLKTARALLRESLGKLANSSLSTLYWTDE